MERSSIAAVASGIVVIAATVALIIWAPGSRPAGFGLVRDGAVEPVAKQPDMAERLDRLHNLLGIAGEQEPAWRLFARRMRELDRLSQRLVAQTESAADERGQHALLFAVALSEIDAGLSSPQSAALQREVRTLGAAWICQGITPGRT